MKHAAFFRNLNLGRPKCPTKAQFETAFLEAGALAAASFLTNGTMVFEAPSAAAKKVLKAACQAMQASCGLVEPAFLRSVRQLAALAATKPFDEVDARQVYACCITFLQPGAKLDEHALPIESPRGDCLLFASTGAEVFSVVQKNGNTVGSPNAMLEKLLARPATSRNWNTVTRLLDKHG